MEENSVQAPIQAPVANESPLSPAGQAPIPQQTTPSQKSSSKIIIIGIFLGIILVIGSLFYVTQSSNIKSTLNQTSQTANKPENQAKETITPTSIGSGSASNQLDTDMQNVDTAINNLDNNINVADNSLNEKAPDLAE